MRQRILQKTYYNSQNLVRLICNSNVAKDMSIFVILWSDDGGRVVPCRTYCFSKVFSKSKK